MSYFYVNEQGSKIGVSEGRLNVEYSEGTTRVPLESIEAIIIVGNSQLSSGAIPRLLEAGTSITWLSPKGKYFGRLNSTAHYDVSKQRSQFAAQSDSGFNLAIAKRFIDAKIKNQSVIIRRYKNKIGEDALSISNEITSYRKMAKEASDMTRLNGYEGMASRIYFRGLSNMFEGDFAFSSRTRQPPTDRFNSLLSFGYTLLLYEVQTAIELAGLNAFAGCMHADRARHPSLASDMMEEWRAVLIDAMVLNAAERRMFRADDFVTDEKTGGIYLHGSSIKKFIGMYETRLAAKAEYLSYVNKPISFRKAVNYQVAALINAFKEKNAELYNPIYIR